MSEMPKKDEWLDIIKIVGEIILLSLLIITIILLFSIIGGSN